MSISSRHRGLGRGCGAGRGRGVGLGRGVGVGSGVGVGVAVGVVVGVGVGPLYNSALEFMVGKSAPPAASTLPFERRLAVCRALGVLRLPVKVQVPLVGS